MTWVEHHSRSERLAADAEFAARAGDRRRALELYCRAAESEELALRNLDPSKSRTYGISAVSVVSLYYKAARLGAAEAAAYQWLASEHLPDFASEQLRGLLQSIWCEKARETAGVRFASGQVVVSVRGGQIVEGGAPLDLIVETVQKIQVLFYRTAEFLRDLPHRKRGRPIKEIQESCRPWLFQAAPGSYQFAVAVQGPRQLEMFRKDHLHPQAIADSLFQILRASSEAPENDLLDLVPDADYRGTFLELTRDLAPTGKRFSRLDIRLATEASPLTLVPSTREAVRRAIRSARPSTPAELESEQTIRGILRALHLDEDWIEVTAEGGHLRVDKVGETVDDVIGPMVNRPVLVQVVRGARGRLHFRDIEADD